MGFKKKSYVFATTSFEAIHCWKDCPITEVSFLRVPHRHIFGVKVKVEVDHADRDIEFIMLQHSIKEWISQLLSNGIDLGTNSCEMLAEKLFNFLTAKYKDRDYWEIEINEDGENGGIVEWSKECACK